MASCRESTYPVAYRVRAVGTGSKRSESRSSLFIGDEYLREIFNINKGNINKWTVTEVIIMTRTMMRRFD